MQNTIKSSVTFTGTGLHSGRVVRMTIHPASAEYGIWFRRTDVEDRDAFVPARWDAVTDTRLNTRIENADGVSVSTIEHVMAALAGCGVHNALIEIDGPEVPLLDGSSKAFVLSILSHGLRRLDAPVRALRILKPVSVRHGDALATLMPSDALRIEFHIDFEDAAIGQQTKGLNMSNGAFVRELCDSRTFCRQADIDAMRARGLIAGGSVTSAVVVDGEKVVTPGGLRHADEPVRHKDPAPRARGQHFGHEIDLDVRPAVPDAGKSPHDRGPQHQARHVERIRQRVGEEVAPHRRGDDKHCDQPHDQAGHDFDRRSDPFKDALKLPHSC